MSTYIYFSGICFETARAWYVYFQVTVCTTEVVIINETVNVTNKDGSLDGICTSDLSNNNTGYLKAGDTASIIIKGPWTNQDIGAVTAAGSAGYSAGTFTVTGDGNDIWNNADAFHYLYQPLYGDGEIIARVASLQNTDPWAKAGVMIRETTDAGSKNAIMLVSPGNGTSFQRRTTTDGACDYDAPGDGVTAPYWVRLVRNGDSFSGYKASDGSSWIQVGGSVTITMANQVYIGLAVTSHVDGVLCTATFDNVVGVDAETTANGKQIRAFTGFDLSSVPVKADVTAATLYLYRNSWDNDAPNFQPVRVSHVDYGDTLEGWDYNATEIESGFMTFNAGANSWVEIPAASQVQFAFTNEKAWTNNGSTRWFQIRLHPTCVSTNDFESDVQNINSVENGTFLPYLRIDYTYKVTNKVSDVITNISEINTVYATNKVNVTTTTQTNLINLFIAKSITNIRIAGMGIQRPIPGSSVSYHIHCSNMDSVVAGNAVIYDEIDTTFAKYLTNSESTPPGWDIEWSTNSSPGQSYTSLDYTLSCPVVSQIKWVRWKRVSFGGNVSTSFGFKVIIK